MTNLKRSFFWAASYLVLIFILGQTDYVGRPIINFASYFYLVVMVGVPVTLFFPSTSRVSSVVPLAIWAVIYLILLLSIKRTHSTTSYDLSVILLELVLLEIGIWFAYQMASQLGQAESLMDAVALSAFPNRARDVEAENQSIKIEFRRSRRYQRPLSVVLLESESDDEKSMKEMLKGLQHDLLHRFTSARIGQIIDESIRQTDFMLRDHRGRFIILCPETDFNNATLLARRMSQAIKEKVGLQIHWGVAAFPEEALTFDDLLQKARERLVYSIPMANEPVKVAESN